MRHINIQPIEKQDIRQDGNLQVNSIFYTIQGEGIFAGRPAVFIRLAGCNLQCPGCDTEYTKRTLMSVDEIIEKVTELSKTPREENSRIKMLVVITGGEPFRQNLKMLTDTLIKTGVFVPQIETNGTLYQELDFNKVVVICSPKTGNVNPKLLPFISAFKYVVDANNIDESDGLPLSTLGHPNSGAVFKFPKDTYADIYVQPADENFHVKNSLNLDACKQVAMNFNYNLCVQIHKQIGVE